MNEKQKWWHLIILNLVIIALLIFKVYITDKLGLCDVIIDYIFWGGFIIIILMFNLIISLSLINKDFSEGLLFKHTRKGLYFFKVPYLFTLLLLVYLSFVAFFILILLFLLSELLIAYLYKKYKPVAFVIINNEIVTNTNPIKKLNIKYDLNSIKYDRISKVLYLYSNNSWKIKIYKKEITKNDFGLLINTLMNTCNTELILPNNLIEEMQINTKKKIP